MSASPTLTWEQYQQLPLDQRKRPLSRAEYAALTRTQRIAAGLEDDDEGAPADFNGPVFPNPNHLRPQLDTDPAMPVTRLPEGVSFQQQNFSGAPQLDISNPPNADVIPAMGREIGAKMSPQQSMALPPGATLEQSPADLKLPPGATLETAAPDGEQPAAPPSFWDTLQREGKSLTGSIAGMPAAVYHAFSEPPTQEEIQKFGKDEVSGAKRVGLGLHRMITAPVENAADWYGKALHGQIPDPVDQMLDVAPEAIGSAAGSVVAGKLMDAAPGAARAVVEKAPAAARAALDATKTAVNKTAGAVRAIDPDVVGIVSPRAAHTLKVAQRAAKVAQKYTPAAAEAPSVADAVRPADELEGVTSPQTESAGEVHEPEPTAKADPAEGLSRIPVRKVDPAEGLSQIPVRKVEPPARNAAPAAEPAAAPAATSTESAAAPAAKPKGTLGDLQQAINDALGGKPLQRGIPLRNQAKAAPLPEDFTPTQSQVLKGYKYDPASQRFSAITNDGNQYTHAEVTPDEFKAFEDAPSKGSAWNKQIRGSHVQVEKNGVPTKPISARSYDPNAPEAETAETSPRSIVTDPETGRPEFSDVVAKKATKTRAAKAAPKAAASAETTAAEDLTDLLKKSVAKVDAAKAAKKTGSLATRLVKGEAGQAGLPGSVTDADEGIAEIQNRPVLSSKSGEVPARGFLRAVGADQNSILKTKRDLDSVFYHRQQILKNGTPDVELHVDEDGNVIGAQGRHRALAALHQLGTDAKVNVTIYKHPSPAAE